MKNNNQKYFITIIITEDDYIKTIKINIRNIFYFYRRIKGGEPRRS